jgi:hypothetical protein
MMVEGGPPFPWHQIAQSAFTRAGTAGEQENGAKRNVHYPRALIVEDETMIVLGLEAHLREEVR